MTDVPGTETDDPDPYDEVGQRTHTTLGGRTAAVEGEDPTGGGKTGDIGEAPSVAADEPGDGSTYAPGGGRVTEEEDAGGAGQGSRGIGDLRLVPVDGVEDRGLAEVVGHPGVGDGHHAQARVLDLGLDRGGDDLADADRQLACPGGIGHRTSSVADGTAPSQGPAASGASGGGRGGP